MTYMEQTTLAKIRPGDRITFGDHTGYYRVRQIHLRGCAVRVHAWFRRSRIEPRDATVWRAS